MDTWRVRLPAAFHHATILGSYSFQFETIQPPLHRCDDRQRAVLSDRARHVEPHSSHTSRQTRAPADFDRIDFGRECRKAMWAKGKQSAQNLAAATTEDEQFAQ